MARQQFPQWRDSLEHTPYPFADGATLQSTSGKRIPRGTFLDAAIYPVGGGPRMRLSRVEIGYTQGILTIGDQTNAAIASGTFLLPSPDPVVRLVDPAGQPAGVLVSQADRLVTLASWGVGEHEFPASATEFAATVCFPQPEAGVRGFRLEDGTVLSGEVWFVGGDGVVLRAEHVQSPSPDGGTRDGGLVEYTVIKVHAVGDPLLRRRLCVPVEMFDTPRMVRTVTFEDAAQSVICWPDASGDIKVTVNNDFALSPALRIAPTDGANRVSIVGDTSRVG